MKTKKSESVNAFIENAPEASKKKLRQLRTLLLKLAPGAEETIAYGIPTLRLNGNLVHYSGYSRHIGFYPGADGIAQFEESLKHYKRAKGSVQFPLEEPLPVHLIEEIVKFRVEQQKNKTTNTKQQIQKNKRICPSGHVFYKTSDCPVCPQCELKKKTQDTFFSTLSTPARRALSRAGIHDISDLKKISQQELASLHGIGPKALLTISQMLSETSTKMQGDDSK